VGQRGGHHGLLRRRGLGRRRARCWAATVLWPTRGIGPHGDLPGPRVIERRPRGGLGLAAAANVAAACASSVAVVAPASPTGVAASAGGGRTARAALGRRGATRGSAGGSRPRRSCDEGGRRRRCGRAGVDLLEDEVVADLVEGGERLGALEVGLHVGEFLVQAAQHIEDEGAVVDDLAKVAESVGHPLHLAAVVADGKIALNEDTELGVEAEGAGFTIAEELFLDGDPSAASRALAGADRLHQLRGEGAQHP